MVPFPRPRRRRFIVRTAARLGNVSENTAKKLLAATLHQQGTTVGFGSARGSEYAEAIVTRYVTTLAHFPLWAVQRACLRFALFDDAFAQTWRCVEN